MNNSVDDIDEIDVSANELAGQQNYLDSMGIRDGWGYAAHHNLGGENGGGSPDVVVAVIDTGVDINHLDLRNNIWTNVGEIPNNGVDDDNNGYIDDVHGWDCVNEDNYPMDDNGHGTHVAGIIAAENNTIGTVGVAFNCKIMPVKAANRSGELASADIAQAITYAYMNGADVINMSFGGYSISTSVQEALEEAYSHCTLVASAGNDSLCNQPGCRYHVNSAKPSYPAVFPYVIGVMSCDESLSSRSKFSNYDHYISNYYEYECYACGEQIMSTWPGNKYSKLSGTSMSAPIVSGITALLRSAFPDRETFNNKWIMSQIVCTGSFTLNGDKHRPACNLYEAFTKIPTPSINGLFRYYVFDKPELSAINNGDGFVDVGETVRIGIELRNRGGKAVNVVATIDSSEEFDPTYSDPSVNILEDTISFGDIGTFSVQDGGKILDDEENVVDMQKAFVMKINPDAADKHIVNLNLHVTYKNGMDPTDEQTYEYTEYGAMQFILTNGVVLPEVVSTDTIFTSERYYVVNQPVTVPLGVNVTFEEGCTIQFGGHNSGFIDTSTVKPEFVVYGRLTFAGTNENPIEINTFNADLMSNFTAKSSYGDQTSITFEYCNIDSIRVENESHNVSFDHCYFVDNSANWGSYLVSNSFTNNFVNGVDSLTLYENIFGNQFSRMEQLQIYDPMNVSSNCFVSTRMDVNWYGQVWFHNGDSSTIFKNNVFLQDTQTYALNNVRDFNFVDCGPFTSSGNICRDLYYDYTASVLKGYISSTGSPLFEKNDIANHDNASVWPYVSKIEVIDKDNNVVNVVGSDQHKARVTFSKPMDTSKSFYLTYGTMEPYLDYRIDGEFLAPNIWEGSFRINARMESGKQFFKTHGGVDPNDPFKKLINNAAASTFTIDTSSANAMAMQAEPTSNGIQLTWQQDDFDTLMGYNVYRSESKDGNYSRINASIIPASENSYLDDNCASGVTYWYTFTTVFSDFSESAPAGKVPATAKDTTAPTIYHTPVNQGYAGNSLIITCTISDNIAVQSATLYYRAKGASGWKSVSMMKSNSRYSGIIYGSEVTMAGMEYYIPTSDGDNVVTRGSAESPYVVIIKNASLLDRTGDVDGDGVVTTKDALMIIRAINDELILTDDQFQRADLDKNGELATFEALRILQYINGNVTTLDMRN